MLTVADLVWIDSAGYHYEDFPTFLLFYTQMYQSVYGNDVYLGSDSQDGQWLALQAQAAYDMAAVGAMTYGSFSPVSAQGTGLSRLVKINGLERDNPDFSTVELVIVGPAGTVITNGSALDSLQQQWNLPPSVTIPLSGTITVTGTAEVEGAIAALPDTITVINTPTLGWQSVNNPAAATPGAPVETDGTLRARQIISVANPSLTVFDGTLGAVGNVPGVTAFQGYENDTNVTDGNGLPPHSIALVVEGGTDNDVAEAILLHKTPGTQTYGTTNVPLTDPKGMPITINFFRPIVAEIGVQVTITELEGWTNDTIPLIQAAVAAAVTPPTIPIGGLIVLTKLYLIAYLQNTPAYGTFDIVSIELQKNGGGFSGSNIVLLFRDIPVCVPGTDVVVVT